MNKTEDKGRVSKWDKHVLERNDATTVQQVYQPLAESSANRNEKWRTSIWTLTQTDISYCKYEWMWRQRHRNLNLFARIWADIAAYH